MCRFEIRLCQAVFHLHRERLAKRRGCFCPESLLRVHASVRLPCKFCRPTLHPHDFHTRSQHLNLIPCLPQSKDSKPPEPPRLAWLKRLVAPTRNHGCTA